MKKLLMVVLVCALTPVMVQAGPKRTPNNAEIDLIKAIKAPPDQSGWADMSVPDRRAMLILIHLLKVTYPGLTKEQLMAKMVQINAEAQKDWSDINWNVVLP